jgi:hypothetical protein
VGSIALCGLLEHMYLVTMLLEASDMFITFASLWFLQVDLLGDEVDNLVALLQRVSTVLEHYSPVLQHYPGVKEVAETIKSELSERTGDPIVQ